MPLVGMQPYLKLLFSWVFVGIVQIAKLSMIPVSCLFEVVFDKIGYSRDTKLSIMLVLVGVAICTVSDVSVNTKGFIAAVVAVWSTALQQYVSPMMLKHIYLPTAKVTQFPGVSGLLDYCLLLIVFIAKDQRNCFLTWFVGLECDCSMFTIYKRSTRWAHSTFLGTQLLYKLPHSFCWGPLLTIGYQAWELTFLTIASLLW